MKRVVFIADDLGLDPFVNEAILSSHRNGALHGASLMMGQPGTKEGVTLARKAPSLQIGWHLHLCDSRPLTCEHWPWGESPAKAGWSMAMSPSSRDLARREIQAQWEAFKSTGLNCAFINSHHHLHVHPFVSRELARLGPAEFSGWFRGGRVRFFDRGLAPAQVALRIAGSFFHPHGPDGSRWPVADSVWGIDRLFQMRAGEIARASAGLPDGLHEFIFHPRKAQSDADYAALLALRSSQLES